MEKHSLKYFPQYKLETIFQCSYDVRIIYVAKFSNLKILLGNQYFIGKMTFILVKVFFLSGATL